MASSSNPNGQPDNEGGSYMERLLFWALRDVGLLGEVPERFRKGSSLGETARVYYSGSLEQIPKDFGTMMMVDGVFLLELMLRSRFPEYRKAGDDDPIFRSTRILVGVCGDILLIENQLPWIVLEELYQRFVVPHLRPDEKDLSLAQLASDFFSAYLFGYRIPIDLDNNQFDEHSKAYLVAFVRSFYSPSSSRSSPVELFPVELFQPSVTTLCEAGVKFTRGFPTKNRLNIEFYDGRLVIPYLDYRTGTLFLNMMVFEEQDPSGRNYVSQFMFFMGWMIRTSKDVDILIQSQIISSTLGSNADLVALFDRIRKMGWPDDYSVLCQKLNHHCLNNERTSYSDGSLFWASLGVAHRLMGKVPERLRKGNEEFYRPRVVSIGPYHDIDTNLRCRDLKLQYADDFVARYGCKYANLRDVASRLGETARVYYSGYLEQSPEDFGMMMLVDGVFLLELMLRSRFPEYRKPGCDDPILDSTGIIEDVCRDILLIENQLPWIVLEELYQQFFVRHPEIENLSAAQLARDFFKAHLSGNNNNNGLEETPIDIYSKAPLVAFVRSFYSPRRKSTPSSSSTAHGDNYRRTSDNDNDVNITVELNQRSKAPLESTPSSSAAAAADGDNYGRTSNNESSSPSVTRLYEVGVKFEKVPSKSSGLNVKFDGGSLKILCLDNPTGTLFLNMMVFEEYENFSVHSGGNYISQFMFFMGRMIKTSKDVDILIDKGIISSTLGSNKDLVALFDRIRNMGSPHDYICLCKQLNDHCKRNSWQETLQRWKETLKRDYFDTPWKTASTIAAVILLVLTLIQTVCSFSSVKR